MTKREPKKILPTMKIEAEGDTDLEFEEIQVVLKAFKDVETKKFGNKIVVEVEDSDGRQFQIFVNNYSLERLNEAWGSEDNAWIGKMANLTKEKDNQFGNEMIVINPVK